MNTCGVIDCASPRLARGLCRKHYLRWYKHGDANYQPVRAAAGEGTIRNGYHVTSENGEQKAEHIRIAERALGHKLPPGALVHHVDENRRNNVPTNLVICPNNAYHYLLHQRMRARDACGNPDWRKCRHCGTHDALDNLIVYTAKGNRTSYWHLECGRKASRDWQRQKRAAA